MLRGRHECRTRTVKICEAALRHPWIHSPHCPEEGGLRSKCSKCGKRLPSPNVCFPIDFGRAPCSSCDSSPVIKECAKTVRDLGLLLPRNSGSLKHSAVPALWSGSKEIEVCRRLFEGFLTGRVQTVDVVSLRRIPTSVVACEAACLGAWRGVADGEITCS